MASIEKPIFVDPLALCTITANSVTDGYSASALAPLDTMGLPLRSALTAA